MSAPTTYPLDFRQEIILSGLAVNGRLLDAELAFARRIDERLPGERLEAIRDALVTRHEALRLAVDASRRILVALSPEEIPIVQLARSGDGASPARVLGDAWRATSPPPGTDRFLPCRFLSYSPWPGVHYLALVVSHLVADAAGLSILRDDLDRLLAGEELGAPPPGFGAFVLAERERLAAPGTRERSRFWFDHLRDLPTYALRRPAREGPPITARSVDVDLRRPTDERPWPALTRVVCAYATAIREVSKRDEAIIRTASHARADATFRQTVGNMATAFAMRLPGNAGESRTEQLERAHAEIQSCLANSDTFQVWNAQPDLGSTTTFRVVFRGERHRLFVRRRASTGKSARVSLPADPVTSNSGFLLIAREEGARLSLTLAFPGRDYHDEVGRRLLLGTKRNLLRSSEP